MNARSWIKNEADLTIVIMQSCIDINREPMSIET